MRLVFLKDVCRTGETNIDEDKIKELVGIPKFVYVNNIIKSIIKKDVDGALNATYDVLDEGKDLENFLWEMIKHSKDILMCKVNRKLDLYNEDEQKQLKELAESVSKEELINIIYKLSELEGKMKGSSQKVIVFETQVIKLCAKMETASFEDRITRLEKALQSGETVSVNRASVPRPQPQVSMEYEAQSRTMPSTNAKMQSTEPVSKKTESPKVTKVEPLTPGSAISGWQNAMTNLKSQGKVMLYANLINTEVVQINDMTVAIRFNNGLTPFRKELLNQSENLNVLNKEIAMLCGKPMQIKFEDASGGVKTSNNYQKTTTNTIKSEVTKAENNEQDKSSEDFLEDLDIEINFVDEE